MECSAVLEQSPEPYTLRELDIMTRAKLRQEWAQVSALAACLINANRLDEDEKLPLDFLVPKLEAEPEPEPLAEDVITDPETKKRIIDTLKGRF